MTRLSGRVPETGTAIQGATVAIIDTQGVEDPSQWSVVAQDTTDANGEWSVSGLVSATTERYHAVAQYDSGAEFVNFESLPYLSTPADVFAPESQLNINTPTPTVEVASTIPDSVVSQYLFEDDSDTTTAIDGFGNTNLTVSGASFGTPAAEGNLALIHNNANDHAVGTADRDVVNSGDTVGMTISADINPDDAANQTNDFPTAIAYADQSVDFSSNTTALRVFINEQNDVWTAQLIINGNFIAASGPQPTRSYQRVGARLTTSAIELIVDGSQVASTSHSQDLSAFGQHEIVTGRIINSDSGDDVNPFFGAVDAYNVAEEPLADGDV